MASGASGVSGGSSIRRNTRSPAASVWFGNSKYLIIRLESLASFQPYRFTVLPELFTISTQSGYAPVSS